MKTVYKLKDSRMISFCDFYLIQNSQAMKATIKGENNSFYLYIGFSLN